MLERTGSSTVRYSKISFPATIEVVSVRVLKCTASTASWLSRAASTARLTGSTAPGSYPADRTADSYSASTGPGMIAASTFHCVSNRDEPSLSTW